DPIPTADYYAMAGIFRSSRTYSGVAPNSKHADDDRLFKLTDASYQTKVSAAAAKEAQAHEREIKKVQTDLAELRRERDQGSQRANQQPAAKKGKPAAPASMPDRKELR